MDKKILKTKMSRMHKGKPMIDTALIGKKARSKILKKRPLGIKKSIGRPKKMVEALEENDIKPDIDLGIIISSDDSRVTRETVRQKRQKIKDKKEEQSNCKVCKKTYKFQSHLRRHMLTHNNHRPHKCTLCNAAFFDSHLLKRHILSHTKKLPFQCHLCEKQFYTKSEHERHLRVHEGEKPYQCKVEGKTRNPREIVIDDLETTLYSLNTDFDTSTQCVEPPVKVNQIMNRHLRSNLSDTPLLSFVDHVPKSSPKQPKLKKPENPVIEDIKKFDPLVIKTDVDSLRRVDSLIIDCVLDDDSPKHVVNGSAEIIDCDSDDNILPKRRMRPLKSKKNTMRPNKLCPTGNIDTSVNGPSISNDSSDHRFRKSQVGASNATPNRISIMSKKPFQIGENNVAAETSNLLKVDHNVSFNSITGNCESRTNRNAYVSSNSEIYNCGEDNSYLSKNPNTSAYDFNTNRNIRNSKQLETNFTCNKNARSVIESNSNTNYESNIDSTSRLNGIQTNPNCNRLSAERNNNRSRDPNNRQSFYDCNNSENSRVAVAEDNDSRLSHSNFQDNSTNEHSAKRKISEPQDECYMIGQYIGSKLRKLSDIMRVHAEKLINDVLYQAQLNALSKKSVVAENGIDTRKRSFQLDNLVEVPRTYFNRD